MSADRFTRAAKVTSSGSWNKYGYALGDPVNWRDPHGRDVCPPEDGDEECDEDPSGGDPSGMSPSNFDQLVILHEFLHYTGVAGPDSQGQKITLPNGDTVTGSHGISQEIKQKCF